MTKAKNIPSAHAAINEIRKYVNIIISIRCISFQL